MRAVGAPRTRRTRRNSHPLRHPIAAGSRIGPTAASIVSQAWGAHRRRVVNAPQPGQGRARSTGLDAGRPEPDLPDQGHLHLQRLRPARERRHRLPDIACIQLRWWQPVPAGDATTTGYDLGLSFPTCRVSSMPIVAGVVAGSAAVFTKEADGGCPKAGETASVGMAGVDTTGDGALDATWGPIPDCLLPDARRSRRPT